MSSGNVTAGAGELTALILAPVGRDARLMQEALSTASISAEVVRSVDEVARRVQTETLGALVSTEEVMDANGAAMLADALSVQPPWSDLPVLILTIGGSATALSRQRERDRLPLENVTLLERPIRVATLVSSVRSALRSRARQYQVRDSLRERDLAVASLKESESRLRLAVDTARLGFWEVDPATEAMEASATCRTIFGWPANAALALGDLLRRIHPEDRPAIEEQIRGGMQTHRYQIAEYRILRGHGNVRWIATRGRMLQENGEDAESGSPAERANGRMVGVVQDVTERVLSEAALRKSDKLALVGRLASSIAHEINNPLEAVTNLLYLLGVSDLGPEEMGYVKTAQQELARVAAITAQTLTFNRRQNTYEEAVLTEILDSVLALYQGRLTTSSIRIEREYRCRKALLCSPGELRQVFTNLVGNAFDAMRGGGVIRLRERAATDPVTGHPGVRITVADTGTGMPPEVRDNLFEAFYSTKGNNGTGLGLWITKGLVEKHGGTLRCSSSTNPKHCGSVFSIFLPLDVGDAYKAQAASDEERPW